MSAPCVCPIDSYIASLYACKRTGGANAAKRIKVEDIGDEVKSLSKKYPLQIPPWFGLIVRTFSALEGLGLGLDSQYSIVNQVRSAGTGLCMPFDWDWNPRVRTRAHFYTTTQHTQQTYSASPTSPAGS